MAFNPLTKVRTKRYPTSVQAELAERLRMLAELPPAPVTPYLTVSLDWRPSGAVPEYRAALQRFEQEARRIQREHWPRGDVFESLGTDIERIRTWLDEDVDPATQGVFIVANSGAGIFETFSLGMPLVTRVVAGSVPALLPLARLDEDNPTYAVLVADQQRSHLTLVSQGQRIESLTMASSDYPRKQQTGGWSQRRFQQRADERIMALGRQISDEVFQYLELHGVDMLIIAGDEVITSVLERTMPGELRDYVVATIRLDIEATGDEIIDVTLPIAEKAEAEREMISVLMVAGGGRVATGSSAVMEALAHGRVSHLILNEDFHGDEWADFAAQRYGTEESLEALGGEIGDVSVNPVPLEEKMVRLALQTGAEIDVIHTAVPAEYDSDSELPETGSIPRSPAATKLDESGGVAAILRY